MLRPLRYWHRIVGHHIPDNAHWRYHRLASCEMFTCICGQVIMREYKPKPRHENHPDVVLRSIVAAQPSSIPKLINNLGPQFREAAASVALDGQAQSE